MLRAAEEFLSWVHARRIQARENSIGYRLIFPTIPPGWIGGVAAVDLTNNWKKSGLNVSGIDYFTMGSVVNGVSTRFDARAKQFQSWIGGYLVRLEEPGLSLQDHLNLAVVDQIDWLRHYGDPHPRCQLTVAGFKACGDVEVCGYTGQLYMGGGTSHIDVGYRNERPWMQVVARFIMTAFHANRTRLRLTKENFMPTTSDSSYSDVFLKGFVICIEVKPSVHAVLYGNGVIYRDSRGSENNTFERIKDSLLSALADVIIAEA